MDKVTAVLPCRKGSTRLGFDKHLTNFAGTTLMDIKVDQLIKSKQINEIIISTDDINIRERYNHPKIKAFDRDPKILHSNDGNVLVDVCLQHVEEGDIIITFCSLPFFTENDYDDAIETYRAIDCDSLMTARAISSFVYDPDINDMNNYDRSIEKWPRTQDLSKWYEIVPVMNLLSHKTMTEYHDRIGVKPYFYELDYIQTVDIDYKDEWDIAEKLWKALN